MKLFLVAALLAVAVADRAPVYRAPESVYRAAPVYKAPEPVYRAAPVYQAPEPVYKEPENEPAPYAFDFSVDDYESGSKFAANENSDGKQTSGCYKVHLPDGRIQTVEWTSDDYAGYNAQVTYEGEAQYPEEPVYKTAEPVYKAAKRVYKAPEPVYKAAEPVYKAPEPVYKAAEPVYKAPEPVYKAPEPAYKEPELEPVYAYRPVQRYGN